MNCCVILKSKTNRQYFIGSAKEHDYAEDENKKRRSKTFQADRIRTD